MKLTKIIAVLSIAALTISFNSQSAQNSQEKVELQRGGFITPIKPKKPTIYRGGFIAPVKPKIYRGGFNADLTLNN